MVNLFLIQQNHHYLTFRLLLLILSLDYFYSLQLLFDYFFLFLMLIPFRNSCILNIFINIIISIINLHTDANLHIIVHNTVNIRLILNKNIKYRRNTKKNEYVIINNKFYLTKIVNE